MGSGRLGHSLPPALERCSQMWSLANNIPSLEQAQNTEEPGVCPGPCSAKKTKNVVHLAQEGNVTGTDQGPKEFLLGTGCCAPSINLSARPCRPPKLLDPRSSSMSWVMCGADPSATWADPSLSVAPVTEHGGQWLLDKMKISQCRMDGVGVGEK